jgi:hypothetical protein
MHVGARDEAGSGVALPARVAAIGRPSLCRGEDRHEQQRDDKQQAAHAVCFPLAFDQRRLHHYLGRALDVVAARAFPNAPAVFPHHRRRGAGPLRHCCSRGGRPAPSPWLPDPRLTPGAFAESSPATICVRGYDRAHRVWHDKAGTAAKYRHR